MNTTAPPRAAMEIAVGGLMKALDDSPRSNWPRVIEMAMTAVRDVGYSEGYRIGAREEEAAAERRAALSGMDKQPGSAPAELYAKPAIATLKNEGEDKALSNEKPSPDEELEDRGFEFIKAIARQIGREALMLGLDPQKTKVLVRHDGEVEISLKR